MRVLFYFIMKKKYMLSKQGVKYYDI